MLELQSLRDCGVLLSVQKWRNWLVRDLRSKPPRQKGQKEKSVCSPCFQLIVAPHAACCWPLTRKVKPWKAEAVPEREGSHFIVCLLLLSDLNPINTWKLLTWAAERATPKQPGAQLPLVPTRPHCQRPQLPSWRLISSDLAVLFSWGFQNKVCERFWLLNHMEGLSILLQ